MKYLPDLHHDNGCNSRVETWSFLGFLLPIAVILFCIIAGLIFCIGGTLLLYTFGFPLQGGPIDNLLDWLSSQWWVTPRLPLRIFLVYISAITLYIWGVPHYNRRVDRVNRRQKEEEYKRRVEEKKLDEFIEMLRRMPDDETDVRCLGERSSCRENYPGMGRSSTGINS